MDADGRPYATAHATGDLDRGQIGQAEFEGDGFADGEAELRANSEAGVLRGAAFDENLKRSWYWFEAGDESVGEELRATGVHAFKLPRICGPRRHGNPGPIDHQADTAEPATRIVRAFVGNVQQSEMQPARRGHAGHSRASVWRRASKTSIASHSAGPPVLFTITRNFWNSPAISA